MAKYRLTSPDGQKFEINAPDDATQDQIMAYFQQQTTQPAADTPPAPQEPKAPQPSFGKTVLDQGLQGATFGFSDEITDRIGTLIAATALSEGSLGKFAENYKSLLPEARASTKDELANEVDQRPVTSIVSNLAGGLLTGGAGATTKAGAAVSNSLRTGNAAARIGKGIVAGATSGAAYGAGTAEDGNRLEGAGQGAILGGTVGGAIPGAVAAGSGIKKAIIPEVDDLVKETALLAQKHGIPLGLDQLSGSKTRQFLTSTTSRVPGSGGNKLANAQQKAFNNAVLKTFGQEGDKITEGVVLKAYKDIGAKFNEALKGRVLRVTPDFKKSLDDILLDAEDSVTEETRKIIQKNYDNLLKDVGPDGVISGEKLASFRSQLTKRIARTRNDSTPFLKDMISAVDDELSRNAPPEVAELLQQARYQYKNLKTVEPLIAKGIAEGNISPALLKNRVIKNFGEKAVSTGEAGDLGELARVGDLIKSKIGDTGTAERLAAYGTIFASPGALALNPVGALGGAAGGFLGSRGYQEYNAAQKLVEAALKGTKKGSLRIPNAIGVISGNISSQSP